MFFPEPWLWLSLSPSISLPLSLSISLGFCLSPPSRRTHIHQAPKRSELQLQSMSFTKTNACAPLDHLHRRATPIVTRDKAEKGAELGSRLCGRHVAASHNSGSRGPAFPRWCFRPPRCQQTR